ncbi:hypothetical protein F5880DRAFT_1607014 [Lentinula raphanica]|nr:hypothetical protein F5880DRAFT_1607014 [Lentinula raphanica]
MSKLNSFAIIGSGFIGSFILSAFLDQVPLPSTIVVLSRDPESKTFPPEVKVVKVVDYNDVDAVAKILTAYNIDTVVSTVGYAGIKLQKKMADASKKAGVKLFAPSEFGSPTDGAPSYYASFQEKDRIAGESLSSLRRTVLIVEFRGLPRILLNRQTGCFINNSLLSITGVRVNGKINIIGKGQSPVSFTLEEDVGGFVAHVLTTLSIDSLADKIFRLEGDRATLRDIAKWYDKEIAYVEAIPGPRSEVLSMLSRVFESGAGSTGWNFATNREGEGEDAAGSANHFWRGHEWKGIRDVITQF